jgi:drug/metabolite transporter (DMT)-like permease
MGALAPAALGAARSHRDLRALGQALSTEAFRAAPPSVVAPFEYTALLWGMGIDWTFWGVLPSARVLLGGGIVIGSGLYLIWHEGNRAAPTTGPPR